MNIHKNTRLTPHLKPQVVWQSRTSAKGVVPLC